MPKTLLAATGTGTPSARGRGDVAEEPCGPRVINVVPWPSRSLDVSGLDPRSAYVEQFWLPVIGPTSTWLMRRFARGLGASPAGFEMDLVETAWALGIGGRRGRNSPLQRATARCARFGLVRWESFDRLSVHRRMPELDPRCLARLSGSMQQMHARWIDDRGPVL